MSVFYNFQKKTFLYSFQNIIEKQIYEDIIYTGELSKVNKKIERYLKRFKDVEDFNSLRTANVDCNYFLSKSIYYGNYLALFKLKNENKDFSDSLYNCLNFNKDNLNDNSSKNEKDQKIRILYNNQIKILKLMIFLYYNFSIRQKSIEFSFPTILDYKILPLKDFNSNIDLFKNLIQYKNSVMSFSNYKSNSSNNKLELILLKYQCGF